MKQARKYVVGHKGYDFVFGDSLTALVVRSTWTEAEYIAENQLRIDPGETVEVYELVPVAAWKCVEAKDGTRRMVRVKSRSKP